MSKTIAQLTQEALQIRNATAEGENTALRVGGLFKDIVDYLRDGGTLGALLTALNNFNIISDGYLKCSSGYFSWDASPEISLNNPLAKINTDLHSNPTEQQAGYGLMWNGSTWVFGDVDTSSLLKQPLIGINSLNRNPASSNQGLIWDGNQWTYGDVGSGGGGVSLNNPLLSINNTLNDNPTSSQINYGLVWDGTAWGFSSVGGDILEGLSLALNDEDYLPTQSQEGYLHYNGSDYEWSMPSGGGGVTLTEPLSSINSAGLGYPSNGQTLKYVNNHWTYGSASSEYPLVDNELSPVSVYPVENKVVTNAFRNVYDKDYIDTLAASIGSDLTSAAGDIDALYTGLTNTYTKQEINNLLSNTPQEDVVIIEPAMGETPIDALNRYSGTKTNKLFRVPNSTGDSYGEYGWTGSSWALLATVNHAIDDYAELGSLNAVESNGIAEVYGVYEDLSTGYLYALTDSKGKIAFAIKDDGDVFYGAGIPSQIREMFDYILSNFRVAEEGKDFINEEYADAVTTTESSEWLSALTNSYEQVYAGVKSDGSFYTQKLVGPTIDRIENALIKTREYPSKSAYIDYSNGDELHISTPELSGEATLVTVGTQEEFRAAVNNYLSGQRTSNVVIKLTADIALTDVVTFTGNFSGTGNNIPYLVIDGCGHRIYPLGDSFTSNTISKGKRQVSLGSFNVTNTTRFISDTGEPLNFSVTPIYTADSQVTLSNGSPLTEEQGMAQGEKRIKLSDELYASLSTLNLNNTDKVFINISCWFVAYECPVTRIIKSEGNAYLYFNFQGGYNINSDYKFQQKNPTFYLINKGDSKQKSDVFIQANNLYYPIEYTTVYSAGNFSMFSFTGNTSNVTFKDMGFEGGSGESADISIMNASTVYIDSCTFKNKAGGYVVNAGVVNNDAAPSVTHAVKLYVNDCHFENIRGGGIEAGKTSTCKVVNSTFKNCGLNRTNVGCIRCEGQYYLDNNLMEDYGYSAINLGIVTMPNQYDCFGLVQNNTIRQTTDYDSLRTVMDSGAIYIQTNNVKAVIRNNRIINYNGHGNNIGIFLDDGAYNVEVYSNYIENIPNSYAIEARWVDTDPGRQTAGNYQNRNRLIAQNVVESGIRLEGDKYYAYNGCYLGTNLFLNGINTNLRDLAGQENQLEALSTELVDGILRSKISLSNWRINN